MYSVDVEMPESMRAFVEEQARIGGYTTANDFMVELVRDAQMKKAREHLDNLITEGINSGPGIEVTPQFWQDLRTEFVARYEREHASK